jgi:VanZ family protein
VSAVSPRTAGVLAWLPAAACMGLQFYLSSLPGDRIHLPEFRFSDKVAHFIAYAGLGAMLSARHALRARLRGRRIDAGASASIGRDPLALVVGILFGVSDEIHQLFVPLREFSFADMSADALGILVGVWVVRKIRERGASVATG